MYFLASLNEIKNALNDFDINKYYIEIDMNGALIINLKPEYEYIINEIEDKIAQIDSIRTTDNVYTQKELFYPVKRITVDEDEDEETLKKFKNNQVIKAKYTQQLNTWNPGLFIHQKENKVKRVAFYSYKGGVGRTTALAIVARLLAKEGLKVAVIDLDLEAPGLNSLLLTKPRISPFGVVDYLYHAPWIKDTMDEKRFISQYIIREDVPRGNAKPGQIILMPAGGTIIDDDSSYKNLFDDKIRIVLEPNYLKKLSYIDFDLYVRQSQNTFNYLLEDIEKYTKADIILIDARTGFSDVSGALLNEFSDVVSIHVQDNKQNIEGIKFICDYINKDKLKTDTIWSYTKTPKNYDVKFGQLNKTLSKCIYHNENDSIETLNYLHYDNHLEDIDAHTLSEYIDNDRISMAYKILMDQIRTMTGLDKKLSTYISTEDRKHMIADFKDMISNDFNKEYISKRFLVQDIELFIGFPGSGKKTFKRYMKSIYNKDIQIEDIKDILNIENISYKLLTNAMFLDWSYEEASQGVCKWLLQSDVFFNWIINNKKISPKIQKEKFENIRKMPEYELPTELKEFILNLVFGKLDNFFDIDIFHFIFNTLTYRKSYVLPKDIIEGVKAYLKYSIENNINNKTTKPLFNTADFIIKKPSKTFDVISEQKKHWLWEFDKRIYDLILAYKNMKTSLKYPLKSHTKYTLEETKNVFMKEFIKKSNYNESDFEDVFNKSLILNIFKIEDNSMFSFDNNIITISPVYNLID